VDGAALYTLYSLPHLAQTLGNFTGGLVGEGEDANSARIDIESLDEESNALDETERLSRAWAGEDEQWLWAGLDCRALRRRRGSGGQLVR
jgi:hypothetical protein